LADYYEAIVRDAVREAVSASFAVGRGVVLASDGRASKECDIIVTNAVEYGPLFSSGDMWWSSPESVRCVIQVKGTVSLDNMGDAIQGMAVLTSYARHLEVYRGIQNQRRISKSGGPVRPLGAASRHFPLLQRVINRRKKTSPCKMQKPGGHPQVYHRPRSVPDQ